ncbi:MAG TPA: flagellar biosynthetic protein FliQ [Bryobacteraceae bacterium]|jgi:flagellar biosynthetic protein FliQ|nr:flagellar biosynthetic protein FliQ [Bryobacteraceae bacterium]
MSQELAIETIRQALLTTLWTALPLLLILFVAGILLSLVQIITSIQDPSFSAVPRLAIFFVTLLIVLPWIVIRLVDYTARLFGDLGKYAR